MQRYTTLILPILAVLATGCASKAPIEYQGQCLINDHPFCSETYEELSTCKAARRLYERETGHTGTCSRG